MVGITYYILNIQNNQKNQEIALKNQELTLKSQQQTEETRQIQLILQLSDTYTEESSRRSLELLEMEWTTHEEFERKYGSDNNPDNFAMRMASWNRFNAQGMLLKNGLVQPDILFGSGLGAAMRHWKKYGEVIKEIRRRYVMPLYCNGFEYMAEENMNYLRQKGYEIEIPDTYYKYIPEK